MMTASTQPQQQPQPSIDLELTPVPGQISSAVLDLDGNMASNGPMDRKDAETLYQMLVETGRLEANGFRRLCVRFASTQYVVTRDSTHIYMIHKGLGNK